MSPQRHVAVTSDQSLIADTVSAALATPRMRATRIPWLGGSTLPRPRTGDRYDVGVMLCDLQPSARLSEAQRRVRAMRLPWLVLTAAPRGPLWGAMLEAGAVAVHPSSASLGEVRLLVHRLLAQGRLMAEAEATELVRSWQDLEENRRAAIRGVRSLSPREVAVLALMHAGEPVQQIAEVLEVSEATVRSHVRAVLQKLDVKTQLAAVAEYELASGGRRREQGE